ncbi:hypothetical protein Y032_0584g308 [Ancylostoma ceylanicum]|uniref:SET domain-containing protein n=1 Tax=Ancylostoma ceylanicum TaxID=53326 RepID=A0A016WP88_9BILA|nr:hypothetical protein Y032_0584g308 [Ancylostoma ceylanicum]
MVRNEEEWPESDSSESSTDELSRSKPGPAFPRDSTAMESAFPETGKAAQLSIPRPTKKRRLATPDDVQQEKRQKVRELVEEIPEPSSGNICEDVEMLETPRTVQEREQEEILAAEQMYEGPSTEEPVRLVEEIAELSSGNIHETPEMLGTAQPVQEREQKERPEKKRDVTEQILEPGSENISGSTERLGPPQAIRQLEQEERAALEEAKKAAGGAEHAVGSQVTTGQLDYVTQQLQLLNETPYREGLSTLSNRYEIADFYRRKQRIPVQDFTWCEVRDIPAIGGRGLFAKVPLPKDCVVCDYSGPIVDVDNWERWRIEMPDEERSLVERYIVEFPGHFRGRLYKRAVLGHDAIYNGTVVLGRLLNHSEVHPNLIYTVQRRGHDVLEACVIFKATRDIRAGEQLLWDYGKDYDRRWLRESCICNACDSVLAEESTALLGRTSPQIVVEGPWTRQPSLSQEVHGKGGVRPPLRVVEVLLSAAHKADSVGFLLEDVGGDALEAYDKSRRNVLGLDEQFTAGLAIPDAANNLCRLFWAAYTDAFQRGNPVVMMLMKTEKDHRPVVVLLGHHIPADSSERYGSCVAYIGSVQKALAVVPQTRSTGDRLTIEEEFKNGTLLKFGELSQNPWHEILNSANITLSQATKLLQKHALG